MSWGEILKDKKELESLRGQIVELTDRFTGRSTRLIDQFVQKLYENRGSWVPIHDHYETRAADRYILESVVRRIKNEHPGDLIDIDRMQNCLKIELCSRDSVLEKLDKLHEEYSKLSRKNGL